ncbi:hypothetical protein [Nostoc sp. PA-18-2419]|uniref:hypothetical protein n=1 Tax=Nostoc sp. PA-18-2419 TaxID=2575443 RepID=UPI0016739FE9|nr:hypothetical protein [Nostoc sp. PA-18-2419]
MNKYSTSDFLLGERIITPAKKLGEVSSVQSKKITITWENGLSAEYTPKQLQAWNYRKFLEDEKEATECNLHNLTSAQELVQDSASLACNSDLTLLEPQRLTNTAQSDQITYNWEQDNELINKLGLVQPSAGIPPSLITKFLEDSQPLVLCPSCELQCIYLSGGYRMCGLEPDMQRTYQLKVGDESSSSDACGRLCQRLKDNLGENELYQLTPENFLEESNVRVASPRVGVVLKHSSKRRQRKGCLYKYIENKKLKDGTITSYPRVIGDRKPDNPNHWRWGFNWEEKIDGEWKGRSIGSVPVRAIALIQSMQNQGVSLEEIIGFIRRAKSKKF